MIDVKLWMPEFKVSAESDPELIKYFLKTEHVTKLLNTSKWLLLGRKGTGKTAIFEYFKNAPQTDLNGFEVIPLNFKEYPWPIHRLYKESMEGELSAYHKSWQYIIIVKTLSKLIQIKENRGETLSKELKEVKRYLETIFGSPEPSLLEIIKSKIYRIDKITLPSMGGIGDLVLSGGEVSFESVQDDVELKTKLRYNAYTLLAYFEKILISNIGDLKILVVLDQLDENWLTDELPEYTKILTNLIHVCQNINNASKFANKLKVVLFLRTDIYDTLKFNDKTKVFQDSAVEIRWDADSLNEMFFERIKRFKPQDSTLDLSQKTNCLFEVRTVRHGATPFKHILRRSFLRPRDVIVFMNKIREVHTQNRTGLYSSKDLYNSEKDYSANIHGELIDEWTNQKPEISNYLNVLQNIGIQTFKFEEYRDKFFKVFQTNDKSQATESLNFLFKNSVVGQKVNANWEYLCTNHYMQIDFTKKFHVNNGLKSRLMLTESRTSSS